jgi:tetratricopeptide (TPR) repeat protein
MMEEKAALEAEHRRTLKALAALESKQGNTNEAIAYLNDLKKREAEVSSQNQQKPNGDVYKEIATLYEHSNRVELAIAEYQAMARALPSDPVPHQELGRIYEAQKKLEPAAQEYSRASQLNIADPISDRLKIGEMYQRSHQLNRAVDELEKLYNAHKLDTRVMSALALAYRQNGADEKAIAIYDALLKIDSSQTWVQDSRAECLARIGRYPEAEAVYTGEIDRNLNTASRQTYANLKHILEVEKMPAKFLEFLKPRFEKAPTNSTLQGVIYDEYVSLGKEPEGQKYITGVIGKAGAARRAALESYAIQLQLHKHASESIEVFRTIAKENPKDLVAWMNLADQLDFNGQLDAANQIYIDQAARTDVPPLQRSNVERRLAMRYADQKKYAEGRAIFQKIFDAEKRDFDAAMRLGDLIEKSAAPEEAIAFYKALLPISSYPLLVRVDIHNRTGNLYVKINKKDEAVSEYRETLKIDPENTIALEAVKKLTQPAVTH